MTEWTFITNHAAVLLHIVQYPKTTAQEIAVASGISERAVRKIIADLYRDEYISKKKEGRHVLYTVHTEAKMRHEGVKEITVGDLLEALGWEKAAIDEKNLVTAGTSNKPMSRFNNLPEQKQKQVENIYAQLF